VLAVKLNPMGLRLSGGGSKEAHAWSHSTISLVIVDDLRTSWKIKILVWVLESKQ
jgi:hypothetical protein